MNLDLLSGYSSLSIIGMCKNAGKTTVLNHILRHSGDIPLGITSIGRDGESSDTVTKTKKPGIYIQKGSIIATAAGLLPLCDITKEILENTYIPTPMGEVIVMRALSDGNIQIAGPSIIEQLISLSADFRRFGAEKIIIDGAVSRKTLCTRSLAEATVLCTGASCGRSIDAVIEDTAHVCEILTLPEARDRELFFNTADKISILKDNELFPLPDNPEDALRDGGAAIYIHGAITDAFMRPFLMSPGIRDVRFVCSDAGKILLSRDIYSKMKRRGFYIEVLFGIRLVAVTVNPFSAYGMHFDGAELLEKMRAAVQVPVIDVEGEN